MKQTNYWLYAFVVTLMGVTFTSNAFNDMDNVTMKIVTHEAKHGHRIQMHSKEIVLAYMVKNGDITEEEAKSFKRKRHTDRKELKALKEAGDTAAFKARLSELKKERSAKREELKSYIDNHDELKQRLREQSHERRSHTKERIRDKRQ